MNVTVLPACQAVFLIEVLEQHQVVGRVQQRVELVVDLGLACGADLVVAALDLEARRDQVADHVVAQVGVVVDRRDREVAALVVDLVAEVAALLVAPGVPPALDGVDVVEGLVRVGAEAHRVEDVELGLGAEVAGVGHARRREVLLRLARDVAGVAAVGLARDRVVHEEVDVERLVLAERVQQRGGGVGEQRHVGLVDRLEAADGRAVERDAVFQDVGCRGGGDGEVLHHAGKVAEADVEILDLLVRDEFENLFGVAEHPRLLLRSARGFERR